jgi:hypothetical protein
VRESVVVVFEKFPNVQQVKVELSGLKGVRLSVTSNQSPGVYHHLDRHLFIALNSDLLAAHTSQSPSGQRSLWCYLSHPFIHHITWPNQRQTRYIASASLSRRVTFCSVLSNTDRSATSALPNSVVAQDHLHQRRRLPVPKPRKPHRPPRKTSRQSPRATPSHSWVSKTKPKRP